MARAGSMIQRRRGQNGTRKTSDDACAILAVETGLTVDRVNEFHEIFSLVDEDHGGSISLEELAKLTDLMNMGATLDEVQSLVDEIDSSGTNNVSFHDFVCSISKVPQVPYSKQDVMEAFKLLAGPASERKHKGQISQEKLIDSMMKFGEPLTKDEAEEIVKAEPRDGMINYDEYVRLMFQTQFSK